MLELQLQHQNSRFEAIEQKAQQAISVSGVVIALITGIGSVQQTIDNTNKAFIILLLVIFGIAFFFGICALWFRDWLDMPKIGDQKHYDDKLKPFFANARDDVYWTEMMEGYVKSVLHNQEILKAKTKWANLALGCTCIELVITWFFVLHNVLSITPKS